jgi:hypothetical protein
MCVPGIQFYLDCSCIALLPLYVCMYVCMDVCIYVCMYVRMYAYMYVRALYVCMHVWVYVLFSSQLHLFDACMCAGGCVVSMHSCMCVCVYMCI